MSRLSPRGIAVLVGLLLVGPLRSTAHADLVPAITTVAGGTSVNWRNFIGFNQSCSVGWSFSVKTKNLTVTSLGLFGAGSLADAHPVGLWTDGGTLLASTTVKAGTASPLVADYRYETVSAVTLLAGTTYRVGAYFPPATDAVQGDTVRALTTDTTTADITFLLSRQSQPVAGAGTGLPFPALDATIPVGVFGASFRYAAFEVGGAASGLTAAGLVLQLDGQHDLAVAADGPFTFGKKPDGNSYQVTVLSSPAGQSCAITGGNVALAGAAVTSIAVTCTTPSADAGPSDAGADADADADAPDAEPVDAAPDAAPIDAAPGGATAASGADSAIPVSGANAVAPAAPDDSGCTMGSRSPAAPALMAASSLVFAVLLRRRRRSGI